MEKITTAVLKEWEACDEGMERFAELFPDGADLKTAAWELVADGHGGWASWLHAQCRNDDRFRSQAVGGFGNTGENNSGDWNSGDWNTGNRNTGYGNSGHMNAGDWNSGSRNTGYGNSGDRNSGDLNSGDRNSGDWNSGDWNPGYFNATTPSEIRVFDRPTSLEEWNRARKPDFIYRVKTVVWVDHDSMTDEQKLESPDAAKRGGVLVKRLCDEAWREAWDETTDADRRLVLSLPNFDADVFLEITGIDVRAELGV